MTIESINLELFKLINAQSSAGHLTIGLATIVADYVVYLVPIFLIATWLFENDDKKEVALKSVSVALIALGVAQIIVAIYPHPRPFMIGVGRTLIQHAPDPSFPSDHMILFCSIAITYLIDGYYVIGLSIFAIGVIVAWSRIYLGVHFPFDMFGSVLISLIVAVSVQSIWANVGKPLAKLAVRIHERLFRLPIKNGWMK
jgi:undecaprenyl-diphosphatase